MEIKEAVELLAELKEHPDEIEQKSLDMAIKSLEAWEKVVEELKKELDDEVSKETITQVDEAYSYGRGDGIKDCIDIIKKHLGEVEE